MVQNLEKNWPVVSKLTWGILQILTRVLESLKDFHFNALLLTKVYIVWAKNVNRSYLSWHWRVTQNLERNRLAVLKQTWGIDLPFQSWHDELGKFWPGALESLKKTQFNWLFLTKVYNAWTKKVQRSYVW